MATEFGADADKSFLARSSSETVRKSFRAIAPNKVTEPMTTPKNGSKSEASQPIVEATRWVRNDQGKISLLASSSTISSLDSQSTQSNCN